MHLRHGWLPAAHHRPHGRAAHRLAQGLVGPQTSHDLGRLAQFGEQARDQALGLGPQGLGLATGLMASAGDSVSQIRTVPSPEPDTSSCRPG